MVAMPEFEISTLQIRLAPLSEIPYARGIIRSYISFQPARIDNFPVLLETLPGAGP